MFVHHHVPCGDCDYCARGHETLCATFKATRIDPGGFAEFIRVPAANAALDLLELPDTVSDEAGTLIEPLACVVRGLDRARVDADTRLLVIGGGQMGLLLAQAALARGARRDRRRAARRPPRARDRARRTRRETRRRPGHTHRRPARDRRRLGLGSSRSRAPTEAP